MRFSQSPAEARLLAAAPAGFDIVIDTLGRRGGVPCPFRIVGWDLRGRRLRTELHQPTVESAKVIHDAGGEIGLDRRQLAQHGGYVLFVSVRRMVATPSVEGSSAERALTPGLPEP